MTARANVPDLYTRYWEAGGRQLVTDQLRATCVMLLVLQLAFSCLDAWAFPEHIGAS